MSMIEVSWDGLDALQNKLTALTKAVNSEEILDEAEALLLNRIRKRFLATQSPDGELWPVSEAARKRLAKNGTPTLFKTGTLFRSIQAYPTGDAERAIGTDVPYARYHNNGEGQVKREFLGFGEEDLTLANLLVLRRIAEAIE